MNVLSLKIPLFTQIFSPGLELKCLSTELEEIGWVYTFLSPPFSGSVSCTATSMVCVAQEIANIFSCVRFCICKLGGSKESLTDTNPHLDFCSPPPLFPLSLSTFPPQSHRSFTIFLIKIYIFNPLAIS